jgi:hypothetical protein
MIDAAIGSAINTISNWKIRREANGKLITDADIERRIRDMWPDMTDAQIAEVIAGVRER